jgi:hypothetical protein
MTVRVKRGKSTFFIQCNATDTVLSLKRKLGKLVNKEARDLRLMVPKDKISTTVDYTMLQQKEKLIELEDKAALDQIGIPDDAVIFLIFWIAGEINASDGYALNPLIGNLGCDAGLRDSFVIAIYGFLVQIFSTGNACLQIEILLTSALHGIVENGNPSKFQNLLH